MAGVSDRVARRVSADFSIEDAQKVLRRLDALELPLAEKQDPERIPAAIVIVAAGSLDRLLATASEAETDWRDVLVAAGLANADWPSKMDELLGGKD